MKQAYLRRKKGDKGEKINTSYLVLTTRSSDKGKTEARIRNSGFQ